MSELDDRDHLRNLDPDGSFERNRALPEQCREAWQAVRDLRLPDEYRDVDQVIVAGMGGSAIAGDFLQALCYREAAVPVSVVRGYDPPRWTGRRTLVIACSHSGNTEETLSVFRQARQGGARLVAVTTGGRLKEEAAVAGIPVLQYEFPPEPRAALGHGFFRLLAIARACGALKVDEASVEAAIVSMAELRQTLDLDIPEARNPAKALARRLFGRLPLVIGADYLAPAARRWKTQINENADAWAFWEELPELHHNTVVGLEIPRAIADQVIVILIEHASLPQALRRRYTVTAELFDRTRIAYERLEVGGEDALSAMLRSVYYANFVSFYLAMLNGVRPWPVANIDWLKARLARE